MNRIVQFLRSLLPADLFQLFFVAGLLCFTVAPNLRWWPSYFSPEGQNHLKTLPWPVSPSGWTAVVVLMGLLFIVAASAGYLLSFWSRERAALQVAFFVMLPSLLGVTGIAAMDAYIRTPHQSVFSSRMPGAASAWSLLSIWEIGSGAQFAIAGIALTGIFLLRLLLRESELPLQLSPPVVENVSAEAAWAGCKRLIWFSIAACTEIVRRGPGVLLGLLPKSIWEPYSILKSALVTILSYGIVLAVIVWAMGFENRRFLRGRLRLPRRVKIMGVAVLLPVIVTAVISCARYLVDHSHWAIYDFGRYNQPQIASYFSLP